MNLSLLISFVMISSVASSGISDEVLDEIIKNIKETEIVYAAPAKKETEMDESTKDEVRKFIHRLGKPLAAGAVVNRTYKLYTFSGTVPLSRESGFSPQEEGRDTKVVLLDPIYGL
jgi:hypothetical protein